VLEDGYNVLDHPSWKYVNLIDNGVDHYDIIDALAIPLEEILIPEEERDHEHYSAHAALEAFEFDDYGRPL
jgi:hypothetical protein